MYCRMDALGDSVAVPKLEFLQRHLPEPSPSDRQRVIECFAVQKFQHAVAQCLRKMVVYHPPLSLHLASKPRRVIIFKSDDHYDLLNPNPDPPGGLYSHRPWAQTAILSRSRPGSILRPAWSSVGPISALSRYLARFCTLSLDRNAHMG